jgi:energy-coupling factor transporter ATP-binding protein EcfA2
MTLKDIFKKPINRNIEGVIKADDDQSLKLEVEEYVLTNEVAKRLDIFLNAYNDYQGANGVWISGFFGSGKSHLLKILAFIVENKEIEGTPILDMFLPKCGDNEVLKGDLKRAASIPSKSILFNIDQKADVITTKQMDALLSVFVKVFDEMCGYYGKQGHIAQFERDLDNWDLYEAFKSSYKEIAGQDWERGREVALLETDNIAQAYSNVAGTPIDSMGNILDKYKADHKVSIEDFAEKINTYVEKEGPNFRLNFFVDEVGQYIADNTKLMTNLQTLAESLATKCRGRAWVVVTSQEDMNAVLGEMEKRQGNDFPKIQDRFANRMKLTSADVSEVIQKRLLKKNEDNISSLSDLYSSQSNNFKTLFDFADGSHNYRNFKDEDHFIYCYPFVPYQFDLFQSSIQSLSLHNAFEGKHSSVGERSMLGVFQQVALQISDNTIGDLATFDLMFEGIRTALKASIQKSIIAAERNLDNRFAIQVLKALFLVKYVKEFKATIRNICVLMQDGFDRDMPQLKKKIEDALNLLENQTYIQRNGEVYEYLTDDEKDVEEEIKNTDVEADDVASTLSELVFDYVLKWKKIRYDETGQDFTYSRKLDDRLKGREHELSINVVSPFHENADKEIELISQSMINDELLIIMPPDDRLIKDLLLYKKTEKYIRQNISVSQQDSIRRILEGKGHLNQERMNGLKSLTHNLLKDSKLFVGGQGLDLNCQDPQLKIGRGFYALVQRTYPNLRYESEQEMIGFIQGNKRDGVRTTLKSLVERFERKPYGWYLAAIQCTLALLCAKGKIEASTDSNPLEDDDLERSLRNTHAHANVILEPQIDFPAPKIRRLKDFYSDFFDAPPKSGEPKALGKEVLASFIELLKDLESLFSQKTSFPFLSDLESPIEEIKNLTGKSYTHFFDSFSNKEDKLQDLKEDVIDPIRRFMSGSGSNLYEDAKSFIQSEKPNFEYVEGDEVSQIETLLYNSPCYKNNRMQQAKQLVESLKEKLISRTKQEKEQVINKVNSLKEKLQLLKEFESLKPEEKEDFIRPFDNFIEGLKPEKLIAVISDKYRRFEEKEYNDLIEKVFSHTIDLKIKTVSSKAIHVPYSKALLTDENDVDEYLSALKDAFMKEIKGNKRIRI